MGNFRLEDLRGCFQEDTRANGLFGKMVSRHPCEVPITDGVYADEECWEPVARLDGRTDNLWAAAEPQIHNILREQRREQEAEYDAMMHELQVWEAQDEAEFDRASKTEKSTLHFSVNGQRFSIEENEEEPDDFVGVSADLHWPDGTWHPEETKEKDPQEVFPQPIKPMQQYGTRADERHRAKRNGGRKPLGRNNCRVHIRKAGKDKQKVRYQLEEDSGGHDLLDEILEDSL